MNVIFSTSWLAPGGTQAARNVRVNGKQLVDDADFFRAATMSFYPRGNQSVELRFVTSWQLASLRAAEVFVMTHARNLPMSVNDLGVVQCICGLPPDTQTVYANNAVLESANIVGYRGLSVDVEYVIRAPFFQTDVPPDIPSYPNPNELVLVYRRATVPIPAGVTSLAVAFSSPFGTAPVVVPSMCGVSGSTAIFARLLSDTVGINGFTVEFSGVTPDNTYTLTYFALQ